jgi:hypothetical protein
LSLIQLISTYLSLVLAMLPCHRWGIWDSKEPHSVLLLQPGSGETMYKFMFPKSRPKIRVWMEVIYLGDGGQKKDWEDGVSQGLWEGMECFLKLSWKDRVGDIILLPFTVSRRLPQGPGCSSLPTAFILHGLKDSPMGRILVHKAGNEYTWQGALGHGWDESQSCPKG